MGNGDLLHCNGPWIFDRFHYNGYSLCSLYRFAQLFWYLGGIVSPIVSKVPFSLFLDFQWRKLTNMLLSTRRFGSLGRRCFSELAENANVNHPRMSIAKNYLKLKRIADSIDENSLRRALTEPCTVDDVISQKNLSGFEVYLTTSTAKIYHAPFVNNPEVWQNWPQWRVVVKEFSKVPLLCYLVSWDTIFY